MGQISALLVHGAGHFAPLDSSTTTDKLTCAICDLRCPDANALHLHLIDVHKLVSSSWNASRDSLAGEPACSHCHSLFETMEGLRSHINQGRCRAFNPEAPTESKPVDPNWVLACCKGQMRQILRDARVRMRLTLHCQGCTRTYTRSNDLSQHLQIAHSKLWADAKALTLQMVELYYNSLGCVCNPSCAVARLNHTCLPYTQLAMQFLRLPEAVFQPWQVLETDLARLVPKGFPAALRFKLEQCLINHDLRPLWNEDDLMQALSHQCLLCGHICPTAELCLHMYEAHNCTSGVIQSYVQQPMVQPIALLDTDCSCFACGQIFNHNKLVTTDAHKYVRQTLVQGHFKAQCPCVLQLAAVLASLHHGGRLADGHRRCFQPGVPGVSQSGPLSGWITEADAQPGSSQETKGPPRQQGPQGRQKQRRLRSDASPSGDGQNADPSGQRSANAETRGHIHLLLHQRGGDRVPAPASQDGRTMAQPIDTGIIIIEDTAEAAPVTETVSGSHGPDSEAPGCPGGIRTDAEGDGRHDSPARSNLPVPGMESNQEGAAGVQKDTPELEQNAPELHRDVGHAERPIDHTTIPCPPGEGEQQCSPLASPGQPTGGQTLGTTPSPCKFQRLDTDGYELEASQQDAISIGAATGTNDELNNWEGSQERQGQGQESQTLAADHQEGAQHTMTRTDMMSILSHAVMENPNNWCFANAAVQSLLWCMLSLTHFDPNMWGLQCSALMNFLHKLNTQAGNLSQESFFTEVLQCWGPADMAATQSSISQQDAAEFVQHWLQLLATDTFDMRWEKRLTVADDVRVMDTNAKHTPICFKFNAQTMLMQTCDLTSLGIHWHQDDGMLTCLVTASDCLSSP